MRKGCCGGGYCDSSDRGCDGDDCNNITKVVVMGGGWDGMMILLMGVIVVVFRLVMAIVSNVG